MTKVYTLRREGEFDAAFFGGGRCGMWPDGRAHYHYKVEICVKGTLQAPRHFVVDQLDIQDYFEETYRPAGIGLSCEKMADLAAQAFYALAKRSGWQTVDCKVAVSGTAWQAGLEARYSD